MINFILFILALFFVVKTAEWSMKSADVLARSLNFSKYLVGFFLVAIISVLPETFISLSSAAQGSSAFGLGTLFGGNVADLSLVLVLVIFLANSPLKIESHIIKKSFWYLAMLVVPLLFGLNGYYSRLEGLLLILTGVIFYVLIFKKHKALKKVQKKNKLALSIFFKLLVALILLLAAAHFTVKFGVNLASDLGINPVLIGMLFVALGTTLPELFFSLQAVKNKEHGLAMGDILGTVITDATIVIGLLAVFKPFAFHPRIVYVTGVFMLLAGMLLFYFMKSGKVLTKKEAGLLLAFYFIFILTEILVNHFFA